MKPAAFSFDGGLFRIRTLAATMASAILATTSTTAQDASYSAILAQRINSLRVVARPIVSIDPSNVDFSDLRFLKSVIGDSRLVLLGEQSHGEGSVFLAKTRLIKFLHEEMGFNALAFESSFPACAKAWEMIRSGGDPHEAAKRALYPLWSERQQVQNLFEYLGEQAKREHNLILAGFDVRLAGRDDRLFSSELETRLRIGGSKLVDGSEWSWFRTSLDSLRRNEQRLQWTRAEWDRFASYLSDVESEVAKNERLDVGASMWRQTIRSISGLIRFARVPLSDWKRANTLRNLQMADNLLWLMNTCYPNERFVVWSANLHIARNLAVNKEAYDSLQTMADVLDTALNHRTYSVAFSGFEGQVTQWDGTPQPLETAFEGSLEGTLEKAGFKIAFLDFRGLPPEGQWLRAETYARPLGNTFKLFTWPNHFDGLFFIRNIEPSKRLTP